MTTTAPLTATTLRQIESEPDTWPFPSFLTEARFDDIEASVLMRRIEQYTAWRSTTRGVIWFVEGPGAWRPPLFPVTIVSTEIWAPAVDGWATIADIPAGPLGDGLWLSGAGPFKVVAEVGDSDAPLPTIVAEAMKRLAEYWVGERSRHAGSSHEVASVGPIRSEFYRDPAWLAKAMQNSGAADLLRKFRRAP